MDPLKLIETGEGEFSLIMATGGLAVDGVVRELGHEPNGPFWDGVAEWLTRTQLPALEDTFDFDSEAGMFCAVGSDRAALSELGAALSRLVRDEAATRALVLAAEDADFEFDD